MSETTVQILARDRVVTHEISVVVPTRNEAGNVEELLQRIEKATMGRDVEVIFVDDSTDETPDVIERLTSQARLTVSVLHRPPERQVGGLGGAVAEGLRAATGTYVVVMDGDLQHPPETIPALLDCASAKNADLVVASRFATAAQIRGLSPQRFAISKLTGAAARVLFPQRLAQVSDPLTGFFLLRREAIDPDRLQPRGFKILLEILVRFPRLTVAEIPFEFGDRLAGESKAGLQEGIRYLTLLSELRFGKAIAELVRFGIVGLSGILVNQLLLVLLTGTVGIHYAVSAALATQGSTLWNFALTDRWVFGHRPRERGTTIPRAAKFFAINNVMLIMREPFLVLLTSYLGVFYLASNLITIFASTISRFALADGWIWPVAQKDTGDRTFFYDIHGLVRIASEGILPELEHFRVSGLVERPDLNVTVRYPWSRGTDSGRSAQSGGERFRYQELLGPVGFWVDITRSETTEVVVGPLVKLSPHVLYTNVVEPILRWMFVQKGVALLHGACIGPRGRAVLVTARTDTGKTSSLLRLLAHERIPFLSDDMIILGRDGRVLTYPKPLTISYHTLRAIDGLVHLSLPRRLALQLQSRVHSKSGRLMALLLTRLPLPAATINAIVQIVVPPPKYSITSLIPNATIEREAVVVRRVEIERGPDHVELLDSNAAVTTLLRNCADAYGFPPYQVLEPFLASRNGVDLRTNERDIIHQALGECQTMLVRRQNRDWWRHIAETIHAVAVDVPFREPMADAQQEDPVVVDSDLDGHQRVRFAPSVGDL